MRTMIRAMRAEMRKTHSTAKTLETMTKDLEPPRDWSRKRWKRAMRMTRIGAPTAPAICLAVFVTAEPADTSSGSRQFKDQVVTGIRVKPMPI